jgi:WD40 repeat protein
LITEEDALAFILTLLLILSGAHGTINRIALSPDGTTLAAAGSQGVWLYSLDDFSAQQYYDGMSYSVAYHDEYFAYDQNGPVQIDNWVTGEPVMTLDDDSVYNEFLVFSPDGTQLAVGTHDSRISVWNLDDGTHVINLVGNPGEVMGLDFSPDGTRLVASGDHEIVFRVWDIALGETVLELPSDGHLYGAVYSEDGQYIATAASTGIVGLWDAESGELIASLEGHEEGVRSVAFSPDGTLLASGGEAGDVCLWDVAARDLITCEDVHTFIVVDVLFDDDLLITASANGTIATLPIPQN